MRPSLKPLTRQSKELVEWNVIYSAVSANACAGAASSKVMIHSSEMMIYSSKMMIGYRSIHAKNLSSPY